MGSVSAFRIFMVAIVFTYFNLLLGNVLFAERKQNEINVIYFITIVINVLFNLILIPRFSLNGAAFATLVAEISFTGIVLFRYPAFLRHFRFDWIWRIACASVAMGLAIVAIRHSIAFPLTVVCGMSVCAGMLAILGTFRSEKELLLGLLRGIRI
jgi:O-antigen/teichoic acid export membrane protein